MKLHPADISLLVVFVALALIFRKGLVSDGFGFDRAFAALFMRAREGETMSRQFALANLAHKRWGCIGCWLLDKLVERNHCPNTLQADGPPTAIIASYRAGLFLFLLFALLVLAPWAVGRFL